MNYLDPIDHSIASKGKRFANYLIDLAVFLVIYGIIIFVADALGANFMNFLESTPFADNLISALLYFLVMSVQEILFKGQSVGKLITGTLAVMEDGSSIPNDKFFVRSLCRLIPFDALSFFGSLGWHDKFSKTRVVNKKEFEQNKEKFNSIESIGSINS